jgi:broad specificity phosphatase PhoE
VVLVSHADIIKAVLAHHLGMPLDTFQRLVIAPASSSTLVLPDGGSPAVLAVNDTSDPADAAGESVGSEGRSR